MLLSTERLPVPFVAAGAICFQKIAAFMPQITLCISHGLPKVGMLDLVYAMASSINLARLVLHIQHRQPVNNCKRVLSWCNSIQPWHKYTSASILSPCYYRPKGRAGGTNCHILAVTASRCSVRDLRRDVEWSYA